MTDDSTPPPNKRFYGSVKVGERGQIVIPAEARSDLGITKGDRLVVLGDLEQGLAILPIDLLQRSMGATAALHQLLANVTQESAGKRAASGEDKTGEEI